MTWRLVSAVSAPLSQCLYLFVGPLVLHLLTYVEKFQFVAPLWGLSIDVDGRTEFDSHQTYFFFITVSISKFSYIVLEMIVAANHRRTSVTHRTPFPFGDSQIVSLLHRPLV